MNVYNSVQYSTSVHIHFMTKGCEKQKEFDIPSPLYWPMFKEIFPIILSFFIELFPSILAYVYEIIVHFILASLCDSILSDNPGLYSLYLVLQDLFFLPYGMMFIDLYSFIKAYDYKVISPYPGHSHVSFLQQSMHLFLSYLPLSLFYHLKTS